MEPRERLRLTLDHQEPDRVPMDLGSSITGLTKKAYIPLKEHLGLTDDPPVLVKPLQTVETPESLLELFEIDTRYVQPHLFPDTLSSSEPAEQQYTDAWGITYQLSSNGYYYDMVDHPFNEGTLSELANYNWPDPSSKDLFAGLEEKARELYETTNYAIIGDPLAPALLEVAGYLRRLDRLLLDTIRNKDFVETLLDNLVEYQKEFFSNYLDSVNEYIQVLMLGDDLGMQDKPMLAPDKYREIVKPRHAELFSFLKKKTDAKIFLHSCGSISPLIDDLIEVGVDIIHPAQPLANNMDSYYLKKKFGDRMCFWGAIDQQEAMPSSLEDVEEEVRKRLDALSSGGGYVLAPGHNIQPDVPPENIVKLFEVGKEYGKYESRCVS